MPDTDARVNVLDTDGTVLASVLVSDVPRVSRLVAPAIAAEMAKAAAVALHTKRNADFWEVVRNEMPEPEGIRSCFID